MIGAKYMYPAEKLAAARRCLMAPHPKGEADSFRAAFLECDLGLKNLQDKDLDDEDVRRWVSTIRKVLDTSGINDPDLRGTWVLKAERLTLDEKSSFSSAVDELAQWFHHRFMGSK